ncbi:hypothetical protein DSUL_20060 [Desulfovibrionales bacterium]
MDCHGPAGYYRCRSLKLLLAIGDHSVFFGVSLIAKLIVGAWVDICCPSSI